MMSSMYAAMAGSGAEINPSSYRQPPQAKARNEEEAHRVGRDFEQMFLSQMLQPMFESVQHDGMFSGGYGEKMFRSLQVDEFAKAMSRAGGIGISSAIARQMLTMQEKANG